MTHLQIVTDGTTPRVVEPVRPGAYTPRRALGPRQLAWIKARGWLNGPRVQRMEKHNV